MAAYAALRHLPWVDDMQGWLPTAVFSQIASPFIPLSAPVVSKQSPTLKFYHTVYSKNQQHLEKAKSLLEWSMDLSVKWV